MVEGQRHYNINNEKLPSVTTILGKTQSKEKAEGLANWRARVGEEEATRIMDQAAARGTAMHTILEHHILGKNRLDLTDIGQEAHKMADVVIDKGLSNLDEIWGSEVALYYPDLYAGATDLVGFNVPPGAFSWYATSVSKYFLCRRSAIPCDSFIVMPIAALGVGHICASFTASVKGLPP